jgi:hypothetical protein
LADLNGAGFNRANLKDPTSDVQNPKFSFSPMCGVTRVGIPVMQISLAIELTSEAPRKKYLTPDIGQALGS